jgi:hypothetical protein
VNEFVILGKYSFGIGDRFCRQGKAQLAALLKAKEQGIDITPVWNKSHREHTIIGTRPSDTRKEADDAVAACGWDGHYFVDADHIGLSNVDEFIESSDFFTLDVADFLGRRAADSDINKFIKRCKKYTDSLVIDGIDEKINITSEQIRTIAYKFLPVVKQAGKIYRHIKVSKGADSFVTEISMDETDQPQTPVEMLFILAAIADEAIPAQTIAPRFTGRFNKGVDFVGDVNRFACEFERDIAVIKFAAKEFNLPTDLKLSVHSGSDKFSIYEPMRKTMKKYDVGLHIKTSGTTWLEELIGLAMSGGDGLSIAKEVYTKAFDCIDELCGPYATVIDINRQKLPRPQVVAKWDEDRFAAALRHNQSCQHYNPSFRQLLHIAYKIAAEMGARYLDALEKYENIISQNVTDNLYERHIRPIFAED